NQLQGFQDQGQYWDAWNIDPNYTQYPLASTQLKAIQTIEQGSVQSRIRVIRRLGNSEFCQDYSLQVGSPLVKIVTMVDWQETHVLVKAAFPVNLNSDYATYEIPCGAIQRPTQPQTATDKAKWEVPALHWADLTDHTQNYGVSLLNDCKYGYDSQSDQLRLTLLRSPRWPDPTADIGKHQFSYALYPHTGSWQAARTVHRGYEFNFPLQVFSPKTSESDITQALPAVKQFLQLAAENLILMAFKPSEDEPNQWILRCYECQGEEAEMALENDLGLTVTHSVDLLERVVPSPVTVKPWKIVSVGLEKLTLQQ
ncbi:MAG: glycoside hydrolase family 38 C-terminal domain-containing protein, partial [Microcystaceae cyanobacterium]